MHKFLYLRIIAIVIVVYTCTALVQAGYSRYQYLNWNNWWVLLPRVCYLLLFGIHSVSILQVYSSYYPDKPIGRAAVIFYRVTKVTAILSLCFAAFSLKFSMSLSEQWRQSSAFYRTIVVLALSTVVMIIQLVGGTRMFQTIRANARKVMEESFL